MDLREVKPVAFLAACLALGAGAVGEDVYTLEAVNDPEFLAYPPPGPTHPLEHSFDITSRVHEQWVEVRSPRHRNLSITLENRGTGLIRAPHLFGPHGWDFRSLEAIAAAVTDSPGLTREEKFIRIHEWKGLHVSHITGSSYLPYVDRDFSSNPLRILNQYGHAMCGQSTILVNTLLREVPPAGSMFGRSVKLGAHRVGEAYFNGAWHAYDATPGTGVVQWIYYDSDDRTIAPSWKRLIEDPDLATRIIPHTNATSLPKYLDGATGETFAEDRAMPGWDFDFDLRPRESLTMHFDMRGRIDQRSMKQGSGNAYRGYSDYASAVFRYRPDLTATRYRDHSPGESNVLSISSGLVPADPSKPSYVIFDMRSAWCFVGATIRASFRTGGRVYVAAKEDPYDTDFSSRLEWQRLSSGRTEYEGASIEGKMAFWVKLEFEGAGSGLTDVDISAEVQMSPWSMPGLRYGWNRILFEAEDMGGSPLRVTYRHDDRSPFHLYEPATSSRGRHVPIRIGGLLDKGAHLSRLDHGKARFWDRLHTMPGGEARVLVEIVKVSGDRAGRTVRRLVDRPLPWGWYDFYWDGTDDAGSLLPRGMYAWKLSIDGKLVHGSRLYLYEAIWPLPNEVARSGPEGKAALVARGPGRSDGGFSLVESAPRPPTRIVGAGWEEPPGGGPVLPLLVRKLVGIVASDTARKPGARLDSLRLEGVLPGLPALWDPAGVEVLVDAGGARALLPLDPKGLGLGGAATIRLRLARAGGVFPGGDVPFSLHLAGDLAAAWLDEGVNPWEDEPGTLIPFGVRVDLDGLTFEAVVEARLTSTAGKGGWFAHPAGG